MLNSVDLVIMSRRCMCKNPENAQNGSAMQVWISSI